jgi:peptide/nickel transport system substrate-binding protein
MVPRFVSLAAVLGMLLLTACQPAPLRPQEGSGVGSPASSAPLPPAAVTNGPTRVVVGVTETIDSQNPYGDSNSLLYGVWCEVLGCLVSYDFSKGEYVPALAESWRVEDATTWIFRLHKDVTWQDGTRFTAADVVHSFDRINNDPASRQRRTFSLVSQIDTIDEYTVAIKTTVPAAALLDYFADRLIITSHAQFERFGEEVWREKPLGTGPYVFKEMVPNQHLVIGKNPSWWGGRVDGPDEVVYRVMREPEVRVTALLSGEIQIAEFIPPHMAARVTGSSRVKPVTYDSLEPMFLAMSPKTPPWDNKLVRQAVAYAIDRDAIIQGVLLGQAQRLDGPIGPGQYAYDPALQPRYTYNPQQSKELLSQAGYPNGLDVELFTPVGRYTQDKPLAEAMAAMLTAVGIRTRLMTPEWSTLWSNVQDGKVPFYYMGRGGLLDPGPALSQYFETGMSPRIGYSSPALDALFARERSAFDPAERKKLLSEVMSMIVEEAPAHFLWRHKMLWGTAENVQYVPRPDDHIYAREIRVQ